MSKVGWGKGVLPVKLKYVRVISHLFAMIMPHFVTLMGFTYI